MSLPHTMNVVSIDRFGGLDTLKASTRKVPQAGPGQVLIKVSYAGVGTWDPLEREGIIAEITGVAPVFPHILGTEGSGTIAAVGEGVTNFKVGERVYAMGPEFYAEYVVLDAKVVSPLPQGMTLSQAAGLPIAALTAMHGLVDELKMEPGHTLLINGASGDTGHLAVQLAKRLGIKTIAVASGEDGVEAVSKLGADITVNGKTADIAKEARNFSQSGLDAVLTFISGQSLDQAISQVREGGCVAYPLGVQPEPIARSGVTMLPFDLTLDTPTMIQGKMTRLNRLIDSGSFHVAISGTYPLHQAATAQQALGNHRVGKIILSTDLTL